jgi:YesN/AraC family two-component response regulator
VSSADGPDALEVLAMLPRVDLLLTDVVMPGGLSGLDLAAAAQARRPDLKVIFMSGYLPDSFDPASRARIRPLLPKPFTASELSRLVSEVLGGQPRREG